MILRLAVLAATVGGPADAAPRPWDDYRAIMWTSEIPADAANADLFFRRLREMGCNAASCYPGMDPEPFVRNGMPFYVENLTRPLFIKGDRGWDQAWGEFEKTRDPQCFIRKPCFNDPAVRDQARRDVREIIARYGPHAPFAYDIRDEPSVTTSANPFDFCLCDICMAGFRRWLQGVYPSLDALNAEWDTAYASWEQVRPLTTDEVRQRDDSGHLNYAPWADHRAFMDLTFADAVRDFAGAIHAADPGGLAGLEGTQMPHAFGGYNFPLLLPTLDWIEPYDIGCSREIVRSLAPDIPVVATMFESDENQLARRLWYLLLHGDRGAIVWWSPECLDMSKPDMPLTEKGKAFARTFGELTGGIGRTLIAAERVPAEIAIHYSQASIRADWVVETRPDGKTWIRRFSSYEADHNQQSAAREAFVKLVEDCGLQADFVSSEQIEGGALADRGFRALIMPRSYALSDSEAAAIEGFCRHGGTVIADGVCGLFDEHCRLRETPALADLFPVDGHSVVFEGSGSLPRTRSDLAARVGPEVKPLEPELIMEEGPGPVVLVECRHGDGKAIYLNLDVTHYLALRLRPGAADAAFRELLWQWLPPDIGPLVRVLKRGTEEMAPACEVHRFTTADGEIAAVMRNPQFQMTEALSAYGGNEALETPIEVDIGLHAESAIVDLRTGEDYGRAQRIRATLSPWEPIILRLRP